MRSTRAVLEAGVAWTPDTEGFTVINQVARPSSRASSLPGGDDIREA